MQVVQLNSLKPFAAAKIALLPPHLAGAALILPRALGSELLQVGQADHRPGSLRARGVGQVQGCQQGKGHAVPSLLYGSRGLAAQAGQSRFWQTSRAVLGLA